jgi:hypothetical protein
LKLPLNSKGIIFLNERRRNVIENKGPLWKTPAASGNVYENKGCYLSKAGMSMKMKGLGIARG